MTAVNLPEEMAPCKHAQELNHSCFPLVSSPTSLLGAVLAQSSSLAGSVMVWNLF